jgi:hypothetical protein
MPGPIVRVDVEELENSSGALESPIVTLRTALGKFYTKVHGLPPKPWGEGEIGQKFAEEYEGLKYEPGPDGKRGHAAVLQSLQDLIDGLQNMQGKVQEMADIYTANEAANRR